MRVEDVENIIAELGGRPEVEQQEEEDVVAERPSNVSVAAGPKNTGGPTSSPQSEIRAIRPSASLRQSVPLREERESAAPPRVSTPYP